MSSAADQPLPPWLEPLDPQTRDAVRANVAVAPPLTDRQRERLRLLFRAPTTEAAPDMSAAIAESVEALISPALTCPTSGHLTDASPMTH